MLSPEDTQLFGSATGYLRYLDRRTKQYLARAVMVLLIVTQNISTPGPRLPNLEDEGRFEKDDFEERFEVPDRNDFDRCLEFAQYKYGEGGILL